MTTTTETHTPAFAAYQVKPLKGGAKKAFWTRIGAAWPHHDGEGFTIRLDCIPTDGRIVIRTAKARSAEGGAA